MDKKVKYKYIIGIDEVGRGPLAGPVTVAAVLVLRGIPKSLKGVKDSKKLSEKQREEWYKKIKSCVSCSPYGRLAPEKIFFAAFFVNNKIIDKIGIVQAINLAIQGVIEKLKRKNDITPSNSYFLLDGSLLVPKKYRQKTIIKGDSKIPVISAASIVAKVQRDRFMTALHRKLPFYFFNLHKGYGTKLHYEMINKFGLSSYHRKSYCRLINKDKC